jgi:hypothetical protein
VPGSLTVVPPFVFEEPQPAIATPRNRKIDANTGPGRHFFEDGIHSASKQTMASEAAHPATIQPGPRNRFSGLNAAPEAAVVKNVTVTVPLVTVLDKGTLVGPTEQVGGSFRFVGVIEQVIATVPTKPFAVLTVSIELLNVAIPGVVIVIEGACDSVNVPVEVAATVTAADVDDK